MYRSLLDTRLIAPVLIVTQVAVELALFASNVLISHSMCLIILILYANLTAQVKAA